MGRERLRLVGTLLGYVVLVIGSAVVMDWFVMSMAGIGEVSIGLRTIRVCQLGVCESVSFDHLALRGSFPLAAAITFWGSLLTAVLVVFQAGTRLLSGVASEALSKVGIKACLVMILGAGATGYLFGPQGGMAVLGITIDRTWAPLLLIAAHIVGIVVLRFAVTDASDDVGAYRPVTVEVPTARALAPTAAVPVVTDAVAAQPHASSVAPVGPADRPSSIPLPVLPDHLRKKVNYTTMSAQVTRAGIDAHREEGSSLLVLWRDVVGVVARRLPAELEGATFVDVVSTAGATLRVMPWTRLSGDALSAIGDERARLLVLLVMSYCPTIQVDPKTQSFLDGTEAAQLPDLAKLTAHDARLA